jgi:hypothetical protein
MKILNEVAVTHTLQLKINDISAREHLPYRSELFNVAR